MAKLPLKERLAMVVALLAGGVFVVAAVLFYRVPEQRVLGYLLAIFLMLGLIMLVALVLVVILNLIRHWFDK